MARAGDEPYCTDAGTGLFRLRAGSPTKSALTNGVRKEMEEVLADLEKMG